MTPATTSTEPADTVLRQPPRIRWYRSPVDHDALAALNRRSDLWGSLQTGGYLVLVAANASLVFVSAVRWPWYLTAVLLFWPGTCWAFLIYAFHELIHRSVFRTRWLNECFAWVFGFLGWHIPSLAAGLWMVPVVITLAPAYGKWLNLLCNEKQHAGLAGDTPDFRLCCRTVLLNPVVQFMNYHTEHRMYAAVPCYNLARLRRLIAHDLLPCPRGLVAVWRQIIPVLHRQRLDPSFCSVAQLPSYYS